MTTAQRPVYGEVVIVAGQSGETDVAQEAVNTLMVEGFEASIPFLRAYMRNGKNAAAAAASVTAGRMVPLGGVFIKQFIERERNVTAHLIHEYAPSTKAEFETYVPRASVLLINTTLMLSWDWVEQIADHARLLNPNIIIVAGGIAVLKFYKVRQFIDAGKLPSNANVLRENLRLLFLKEYHSSIDFFIASNSGEYTLLSLLDSLAKSSEDWKTLPGVCWQEPNAVQWNMNPMGNEPISDVEVDWAKEIIPNPERIIFPIQVGYGCPFKCGFCDFHFIASKPHQSDLASVIRTLKSVPLIEGVRRVFFTNENLLLNSKQSHELLQAIIDADLHLRWTGFVRIDAVQTSDIVDLIVQSGCEKVLIGVESGDETVLRNMNKHCAPALITRALSLLLATKIAVHTYLLVGFPGETEGTIANTVRLFNELPEGGLLMFKAIPLIVAPLSPISMFPEQRVGFGLVGVTNKWRHTTMDYATAHALAQKIPDMMKSTLTSVVPIDQIFPVWDWEKMRQLNLARNVLRFRQRGLQEQPVDPRTDDQLWSALEANLYP
ncbi:radical SAM protein [Pelomyxa schiedti]|nr:radical SAM protein [Pelomyxa schiedti]